MKAAYVKVPFEVKVIDVALREVGPNDALVKIKACGICGSEMHTCSWGAKEWSPIGHEITGIVQEMGNNVTNVKPGDRVALESGSYCGTCELCRNGRASLCNKNRNVFAERSMGFAEAIVVNKQCLVHIGEKLPFDEATLIEPMGVALDLFYTADIKLNDDVLIIGLGPIGLMALCFARLGGARKIYAADLSACEKRIDVAKMYGSDEIIYTDKTDIRDYPFERGGVEKILITAPPKTIPTALDVANIGGTVAFLGIQYGEGSIISFDANKFHFKKMSLKASYAAPALFFPQCIDMIRKGMIDVKPLITSRFKLEEIESAILNVRDNCAGNIKSVMIND